MVTMGAMRNVVIFVCAFCYIFPVFIKYLPIPLDRVLQVVGFLLLFLLSRYRQYRFIDKKLLSVFLINIVVVILAFFAMVNGPTGNDSYLFKQTLDIYFLFPSALLLVYLLVVRYGESFTIVKVFDLIVYLFLFQAIISIVFFLSPTIFNFYLSLLKEDVNRGLFLRTELLTKRFIGWGSAFFSGAVKYGFAFLILVVLPYCKESAFYRSRLKYICSLSIIVFAGAMTGRFFFLAIGLGLLLAISIDKKNIFRIVYRGIPMLIAFLLMFYVLGQKFLGAERFEIVYGFVFELFLTFLETGELSTTSSEATLSMYVFPNNISTWFIGDGVMFEEDGSSYYMKTDVGYVRLLFYFGIIATTVYFMVQYYFYRTLILSTNRIVLKKAFLFMFFWVCVYHAKGLVSVNEYVALFLLALVSERRIARRKIGT